MDPLPRRHSGSPDERIEGIPEPVAAIVMRMLAKTAEDRYQTAAGVEADLRKVLEDWESLGRINSFPLGKHDASDRLRIPEQLYGRYQEVKKLLVIPAVLSPPARPSWRW